MLEGVGGEGCLGGLVGIFGFLPGLEPLAVLASITVTNNNMHG